MIKYGIEVEGRYKGLPSIFATDYNELVEVHSKKDLLLEAYPKCRHLYYRCNTLEYLEELKELSDYYTITVETNKVIDVLEYVSHIILTVDSESFWKLRENDSVKFTRNDYVHMITKDSMIRSFPEDFEGDVEID